MFCLQRKTTSNFGSTFVGHAQVTGWSSWGNLALWRWRQCPCTDTITLTSEQELSLLTTRHGYLQLSRSSRAPSTTFVFAGQAASRDQSIRWGLDPSNVDLVWHFSNAVISVTFMMFATCDPLTAQSASIQAYPQSGVAMPRKTNHPVYLARATIVSFSPRSHAVHRSVMSLLWMPDCVAVEYIPGL